MSNRTPEREAEYTATLFACVIGIALICTVPVVVAIFGG